MDASGVNEQRSDQAWKVLVPAVGALAAALATQLVMRVWRRATGNEVPLYRVAGSATRRHIVVWVVVSGTTAAAGRLLAERGAAAAWKRKTGEYPRPLAQ
jgi:Protein of unknown function (DUF4235)